jgi:trimethylamine--corrinoid protein Co-methyltransferase
MIEKGPGKDFLAEEHTVRHMRGEFFVPRLANRQKREKWTSAETAMARAKAFIDRVRSDSRGSFIDGHIRREILARFPQIQEQRP